VNVKDVIPAVNLSKYELKWLFLTQELNIFNYGLFYEINRKVFHLLNFVIGFPKV